VGPRAGLDTEARGKNPLPLPGIEHRSPGHPARLYQYKLKFQTKAILKSTVKENNDSNLTRTYVHDQNSFAYELVVSIK
jgi:hypothetical protein